MLVQNTEEGNKQIDAALLGGRKYDAFDRGFN